MGVEEERLGGRFSVGDDSLRGFELLSDHALPFAFHSIYPPPLTGAPWTMLRRCGLLGLSGPLELWPWHGKGRQGRSAQTFERRQEKEHSRKGLGPPPHNQPIHPLTAPPPPGLYTQTHRTIEASRTACRPGGSSPAFRNHEHTPRLPSPCKTSFASYACPRRPSLTTPPTPTPPTPTPYATGTFSKEHDDAQDQGRQHQHQELSAQANKHFLKRKRHSTLCSSSIP